LICRITSKFEENRTLARFLALDWDHNQLHLVVATTGRGGMRVQRALVWHEDSDPGGGQPEALGQRLREHMKNAGIPAAPVVACLGRDRVILKNIRYPKVPPSEEAAVVRFQAAKELAEAGEDVVIDYTPIGEPGPDSECRAFALIARRQIIAGYQTLCRAAGLKLVALTPRSFGIAACLERVAGATPLTPAPESPAAVSAVLTVTEGWAEFCVIRAGTLLYARALPVGNNLVSEVRRNLAVYAGQPQVALSRDVVRALYVAGNGEETALRERLQQLLAIPVHPLDPFACEGQIEVSMGSRAGFAGTVGLLHLWSKRERVPINLVHVKEPVAPVDPYRTRKIAIAAAVLVLFLLGALYGNRVLASKREYQEKLTEQKADLDAQLRLLAPDAKHIEALKEWNDVNIPWLDELYDLSARFPHREGMRVTQLQGSTVTSRTGKDKNKTNIVMTISGIVLKEDEQLVRGLMDSINTDPHTRASMKALKSGVTGAVGRKPTEEFTLKVDISKQSPSQYTARLVPPEVAPWDPANFFAPDNMLEVQP
jgi:Tfp pilus assembly PilM family ATPase